MAYDEKTLHYRNSADSRNMNLFISADVKDTGYIFLPITPTI